MMKSKMKRILLDGNAVVLVNEDFINLQESETVWFENIDKLVKEVAEFLNSQGYVAEGNESPWISVKDKLPEEDDNYLVYGASYLGSIINGSDYFDVELGDWWEHPHDQITHWMSLPKPPESED